MIYVGTFSKALYAGLRVGYVVAPMPLLARLAISRFACDFNTDVVTQAALTSLIEAGGLERHVRRVRKLYAPRREALLEALAKHLPEGTHWQPPAGGNVVWVRLPDACDLAALHDAVRSAGIALTRGDSTALPGGPVVAEAERHVALSFARVSAPSMDEAIGTLGKLVKRACSKTRRVA